jgi:4-carboxymuconolactone decarboxylase
MSHIARLAAAALSAFCLLSLPLKAQDRMPPIPADKLTEAQKKAAEVFAEGRGYAVRGPFVPLIRSPEVMLRAKAMATICVSRAFWPRASMRW